MLDAAAIVRIDPLEFTASTEPDEISASCSRRDRLSNDPRKAAALQRARRRIAKALDSSVEFSIARLRLNAGLSQSELARLMGTQQPAIARLEKGQTDPQLSTMQKLADAFGVSPTTVMEAFINTKSVLEKK